MSLVLIGYKFSRILVADETKARELERLFEHVRRSASADIYCMVRGATTKKIV